MGNRLKVYLDSSIASHLDAPHKPEEMRITKIFWDILKTGIYDVYISDVVIEEYEKCREPKRTMMLTETSLLNPMQLEETNEVVKVAQEFIDRGILKSKNILDCKHLAVAMISEVDVVVSWNFNHLVNITTLEGVKLIAGQQGYKEIWIVSPSTMIGGTDGK